VIEEHDRMSGVMSVVEAETGVAIAADFGYSFGNRGKFLHLTPEPNQFSVGIAALKGKNSAPPRKILAMRQGERSIWFMKSLSLPDIARGDQRSSRKGSISWSAFRT
jgi:hypothetical protein